MGKNSLTLNKTDGRQSLREAPAKVIPRKSFLSENVVYREREREREMEREKLKEGEMEKLLTSVDASSISCHLNVHHLTRYFFIHKID